jgi:hypothetical protein
MVSIVFFHLIAMPFSRPYRKAPKKLFMGMTGVAHHADQSKIAGLGMMAHANEACVVLVYLPHAQRCETLVGRVGTAQTRLVEELLAIGVSWFSLSPETLSPHMASRPNAGTHICSI